MRARKNGESYLHQWVLAGSDKYSAPVPVIGLYIAAASAVCSLLMLYDIIDAFIKRRRWLPCKLFKLNSVTLSLIGVVVKITVDLTTSMPSALDQLSKLAGTTSLCIYMCCVFPSVGDMKDSTNMFALSILVITDIVNICIQLSTGVIVFFIPEHIAILFIMLLLLLITWYYILTTKREITSEIEYSRSKFISGRFNHRGIFMKRLESVFKDGFRSNTQIKACRSMECGIVGDLSLICFAVLIQATIRTTVLKKRNLCGRTLSDYSWSMEAIVATQLATVTIGTFASYARRCTMITLVDIVNSCCKSPIEEPYNTNPIWGRRSFLECVSVVYTLIIFVTYWLLSMPILLFYFLKSNMTWEFFKGVDGDSKHKIWLRRKINTEVGALKEKSKRKSSNLCNLLTEIVPPKSPETTKRKLSNFFNFFRKNDHPTQSAGNTVNPPRYQGPRPRELLPVRARLLPLVVLVRFIQVAIIPESLSRNIVRTFKEAFETLHFIEKHMYNTSGKDTKETEIAKAVWMARDFNHFLPDTLRRSNQFDGGALDRAFRVMDCIHGAVDDIISDPIVDEIRNLRHLLMLRGRESFSAAEELSYFLKDLFVDLLDPMLAQLPEAIFKAVSSSPDDEYEKRVRQSIEHLCKFESWEGIARWKPPKGCRDCYKLLDPQKPNAPNSDDTATRSRNDMLTSEVPSSLLVQVTATMNPGDIQNEGNDIFSPAEHHVTINSNEM